MQLYHSEQRIKSEISKLKPIKYNQFRWWRRWDNPRPPLGSNKPLLDRIKNGDFDFSNYYWQSQYCVLEMEHKKTTSLDNLRWIDDTEIDRARYRKLIADFDRDEKDRLADLKKSFMQCFHMSEEDYYSQIEGFDGGIEDFYHHISTKFFRKQSKKTRTKTLKKDFLEKIF